jgi:hypothetical protein
MSVGWGGADNDTEMAFGSLPAIQDMIVLAAVWVDGRDPHDEEAEHGRLPHFDALRQMDLTSLA